MSRSTAVVGGGVLGLTLALRLAQAGDRVTLLEAAPQLGGLACAHDYGAFVWDRFYHCILPQDTALLSLLDELGLSSELRWSKTGTGYYADGVTYDMNGSGDWLRFPLLSLLDKARLGALIMYATRGADPMKLFGQTAEVWLSKICGRRGYEVFWRPLLRAKFGPYHDKVAAVFIWATLTRLFGARSGADNAEKLGYVSGGYGRILERFAAAIEASGGMVRVGAPAGGIAGEDSGGSWVRFMGRQGEDVEATFDRVLFTGPTGLAARLARGAHSQVVQQAARDFPTAEAYLGVACLTLALPEPLTPYYVLNIGDERVQLTGLVEMTNLVDRAAETDGLSLVYLPQYMDSADARFDADDEALIGPMLDRGLKQLFPRFRRRDARYVGIHRARFVQPLPLVRHGKIVQPPLPSLEGPFTLVNTSMLSCATLNNNEVVKLAGQMVGPPGGGQA